MSIQMCTFWVGENLLGLPVEDVHEIARVQNLATVPLAPATIAGLMNLRGEIVPVIDARTCLGLEPLENNENAANVILRGEVAVSLTVDEIGDIITIEERQLGRPPEHMRGVMRTLVRGVVPLGEELVLLVSAEGFLSLAVESVRSMGDKHELN